MFKKIWEFITWPYHRVADEIKFRKKIRDLKKKGIGVLITDHNVRETLSIVDRAYLIHEGKVLCEGSSDFLVNDEKSRKFYLGENFSI